MQNRSREIHVNPIPLDPAFPINVSGLDVQTDRPISFLHVHNHLELGYCYSGSGIFVVGEKVLPFQAGDVTFINSSEVHLASSAPGTVSEWVWMMIDPLRMGGGDDGGAAAVWLDPAPLAGPAFQNVLTPECVPDAARIVLRIVEEWRARRPGVEWVLRGLVWELMVIVRRSAPEAREPAARGDYERLAPALQTLARDYAAALRIDQLAHSCGLSEPHFRRLFLRTLGRSPRAYWYDLRLRLAASLLRGTRRSVLEISQDVGFETLSSFNRLFKAHFGQPPRQWRNGAA